MNDLIQRIQGSSSFIRENFPKRFSPELALIKDRFFSLPEEFRIVNELKYSDIPNFEILEGSKTGSILFCRLGKKDVFVYNGRLRYYDGSSMKSIAHKIYVLKALGIKRILAIDEVGHLNPRFKCGELALIYDHINLMGDNPLIGKNEDSLGVRFPDMSNAYDKNMFRIIQSKFLEYSVLPHESVYFGITGPNSETEAEARFYREAGGDVVGYSLVPENITAVHAGISFSAIGLITRQLVADVMMEETRSEKELEMHRTKSYNTSTELICELLPGIISAI